MAEVLLNQLGNSRYEAVSAGAKPAGYVHPLAIRTLQDAGYPVTGLRSKSWEEFKDCSFDIVITVCDRAKDQCPVWMGSIPRIAWSFEDPAEATGTDEEKQIVFQKIFMEIQQRIRLFLSLPDSQA